MLLPPPETLWQRYSDTNPRTGLRRLAHPPDAKHYVQLLNLAYNVHAGRLVVVTTGSTSALSLVLNWVTHAQRVGVTNALVLCMDRALHRRLTALGTAGFDDSGNMARWNQTHIMRPMQRIFLERFVAITTLIIGGYDVVHSDADCIFLRDPRPFLMALPADVHMAAQRDLYPELMLEAMGGYAACMGFLYLRSDELVARFLEDALHRAQASAYRTNALFQYGFK